jgi:hypothetical protein
LTVPSLTLSRVCPTLGGMGIVDISWEDEHVEGN